jgi:hypothetical protein
VPLTNGFAAVNGPTGKTGYETVHSALLHSAHSNLFFSLIAPEMFTSSLVDSSVDQYSFGKSVLSAVSNLSYVLGFAPFVILFSYMAS